MTTATALDVQHDGSVITEDRAGFAALRAELHERSADLDLIELWADLRRSERCAVLKSAQLDESATLKIGQMSQTERDAVRAAIHRMSRYAGRLKDRLTGGQSAAAGMAANAAAALSAGNQAEALHWLSMIQKEAA